jgi:predicted nucleotidyltransferase
MNIKITKEEFDFIMSAPHFSGKKLIGSRLYETNTADSDTDYLVGYTSFHESDLFLPNLHTFQYDDKENNTQYVFSTPNQFWSNLFSGDSIINADVILYDTKKWTSEEQINILRTYNIIKAFIGFAKRDYKDLTEDKGKNKLFHICRCLYFADELLDNRLPKRSYIKYLFTHPDEFIKQEDIQEYINGLRQRMNKLYENNELTKYPVAPIKPLQNSLEVKLFESNNKKKFFY